MLDHVIESRALLITNSFAVDVRSGRKHKNLERNLCVFIKLIPFKLYTVHTGYCDNHFELSVWLWILLLQPKWIDLHSRKTSFEKSTCMFEKRK